MKLQPILALLVLTAPASAQWPDLDIPELPKLPKLPKLEVPELPDELRGLLAEVKATNPEVDTSFRDEDGFLRDGRGRLVIFIEQGASPPDRRIDAAMIRGQIETLASMEFQEAGYTLIAASEADRVLGEIERQRLATADPEASRRIVDGLQADAGVFLRVNGWVAENLPVPGSREQRTEIQFWASCRVVDFRNLRVMGGALVDHVVPRGQLSDHVKVAKRSIRALTRATARALSTGKSERRAKGPSLLDVQLDDTLPELLENPLGQPEVELVCSDPDGLMSEGARVVIVVDAKTEPPHGIEVDVANLVYDAALLELNEAGYDVVSRAEAEAVMAELERAQGTTADPEASRRIVDSLQADAGLFISVEGWTRDSVTVTEKGRVTGFAHDVSFFGSLQLTDFRNLRVLGSGTVTHTLRAERLSENVAVAHRAIEALTKNLAGQLRAGSR